MAKDTNRQTRNQQAAIARRAARKKAERKRNIIAGAAVLAVVAIVGSLVVGLGGSANDTEQATDPLTSTTAAAPVSTPPRAEPVKGTRTITGPTPCPAATGEAQRVTVFEQAPPVCIDPAKTYTATMDMNVGKVVVNLDDERSPIAVNNFVVLSRYGFYDGTAIFRTDPSIDIIQGGSPNTQTNNDSPGYSIKDDAGRFTYKEGELIMARGSGTDSAGSQFFFSTGPEVSNLDNQGVYVTIGKVSEGLDVLKTIIGKHVATGSLGGAPGESVIVNKVTITES